MSRLTLIDLFAGCGGLTRGFVDTGSYVPVFAVESDTDGAATYAANFGDHVFPGLIEDVEKFPTFDVVVGGPPCQGFSPLNMGRVLVADGGYQAGAKAVADSEGHIILSILTEEELRSWQAPFAQAACDECGHMSVIGQPFPPTGHRLRPCPLCGEGYLEIRAVVTPSA